MGKREIVIGEKEKHTLEISWSNWLGDVTVKIDGQFKKDIPFRDLITFQRAYDFSVGTNEAHSVHIEVDGDFNPPIKAVVVDGKVIE